MTRPAEHRPATKRSRPHADALVAAAAGAVLGTLGARVVLVGSGLSLIPWTVCGLAVGSASSTRHRALANGATYGFVLAFTFMLAGYDGSSNIITRVPFFAALGLFGAACGVALSSISHHWLRQDD